MSIVCNESTDIAYSVLEDFSNIIKEHYNYIEKSVFLLGRENFNVFQNSDKIIFSDTVIICYDEDKNHDENRNDSLDLFINFCGNLSLNLFLINIPVRGLILKGDLRINKDLEIYVGKPLIQAYEFDNPKDKKDIDNLRNPFIYIDKNIFDLLPEARRIFLIECDEYYFIDVFLVRLELIAINHIRKIGSNELNREEIIEEDSDLFINSLECFCGNLLENIDKNSRSEKIIKKYIALKEYVNQSIKQIFDILHNPIILDKDVRIYKHGNSLNDTNLLYDRILERQEEFECILNKLNKDFKEIVDNNS